MAISSNKVRRQITLKKTTWENIQRIAKETGNFASTMLSEAIEKEYGVQDNGRESANSKK